jgi:hypothetical protein
MVSPELILDRIANHLSSALRKGIIELVRDGADGREDSQKSERRITQTLALQFEADQFFADNGLIFEPSPARYWYDFLVEGEDGTWLPVNVKISGFGGSDNLASKEGLFYAMTGVDPKKVPHRTNPKQTWGINSWEPYCEAMAHYFGASKGADYYFLVINKTDIGHVFWTSLRHMAALDPNGNNLPYQAHWARNTQRVERTWEESAQFLMGVFREALVLRARVLNQFDASVGEKLKKAAADD